MYYFVVRATILSGASRGLGASLFDGLVTRGDRVLCLARSFPAHQHSLSKRHPDRVRLVECDLGDSRALPNAASLAWFLGGADEVMLINNAATIEPIGAVGTLAEPPLATAVAVNLLAPMLLTNALLAAVRDQTAVAGVGPGIWSLRPEIRSLQIIFITSSVAHRPKPGNAIYGATKAGGSLFFDTLRAELDHEPRVMVTTIDPGGMDTDMHAFIRNCDGVYFPDRERLRVIAASGQLAHPDVVARRILDELFLTPHPAAP